MKKSLNDLNYEELKMLRDLFIWYNKQPKIVRKEIIKKIEEKINLKGVNL